MCALDWETFCKTTEEEEEEEEEAKGSVRS
jgi:hypothetical protein